MSWPQQLFRSELAALRDVLDARLDALLPSADEPPVALHRAMRHSLLAPGKRVRPVLTMVAAEGLGAAREDALDPACAIELVHTASLILDDLPCMDDARLRRGVATCHRVFGQDVAILAAVDLLNRAYGVTSQSPRLSASLRLELVQLLVGAIGDAGIVAGQVHDLDADRSLPRGPDEVERVAGQKTGSLFVAAAETGARIAGASDAALANVREYARSLGTCFQVLDDIADHGGTEHGTGKDVGQDRDKTTFVWRSDPLQARDMADRFAEKAKRALEPLGPRGNRLAALVDLVVSRESVRVSNR